MFPSSKLLTTGKFSEMTFDPSITLGAILNAVVLLVGFVGAFVRIGGRIDLLSLRLGSVEEAVKGSGSTEKQLAILNERQTNHATTLATVQRDISDLRHGEGFIAGRRSGIDGEHP
jgi:hypothetical protein